MEEGIIIEKALENLEKQTGVTAIWRPRNGEVDGEIVLTYNDKPYRMPVEIKKEVRAHQLGKLFDLKKQLKRVMVVAEYITCSPNNIHCIRLKPGATLSKDINSLLIKMET